MVSLLFSLDIWISDSSVRCSFLTIFNSHNFFVHGKYATAEAHMIIVWTRPGTEKISESGINVGFPQYSPTLHLTLYVKLELPLTFLCTEHSDWLRHSWLGLDQGTFLTNLQSWASMHVDPASIAILYFLSSKGDVLASWGRENFYTRLSPNF